MDREEALERLNKKRTLLRTSLSKYWKRKEESEVHKECDHEELMEQLSDVYGELRRVDEEIGKLIDIKDLEKDLRMVEEYREKAVTWKSLLKRRSLVVADGIQRETATKKEYPGEISRPAVTGMIRSLESLSVVVESYGNLLCPLLLKLLPSDLKLELHREFTGAFSLGDLIEFLKRQLIALESTFGTRDEIITSRPSNERPQSQISIMPEYCHLSKFCKIRESSTSCGELRHLRIMCPRKNQNEEIATPARGIMKDETLTNLTTTSVVLLPTMRVTIRELYEHRVYDIRLTNLDGSYGCNFEALSQDVTATACPRSIRTSDLDNLWRLEAIHISDTRQNDSIQKETEEYFARTVSKDCEVRYQVALPWIREREVLKDNRDVAEKRLANLGRHLENTGNLTEFEDTFENWLKNKIIETVTDNKREGVHYLPPRPVFKENIPTTKIRPVFDASARKKGKFSLNDCLERGPNLIETIPRILDRFRKS
ncbi:hypothetical protein LAZ67_18000917 [Cordylochernes scorpioides]|uniref:Uncharacterized protein n=1 Tax=Cordylochernes scorpioides TaxID=51811 RepID=A0ABY6LFE1_9ARAC|nr:hypothetical protein LAZ67_18000917 [Cordylochernes scorpioides]